MMNQNEEHEDILFEEKKKQTDRREAGMGADGEFSAESLKKWFTRAGGALAACAAARLPDGGSDGWKESERVPDHGSEFRYPDGIYHEPEGRSAVGIRKDGEDK